MSDKLVSKGLGKGSIRLPADHITVSLDSEKNTALALVRSKAKNAIYNKWPVEKQINAALGLLTAPDIAKLKADIQFITNASNGIEQAITAITAENPNDLTEQEKTSIRILANSNFHEI